MRAPIRDEKKIEAYKLLVDGIAHDLNNLLSGIMMANHFLMKNPHIDDSMRLDLEDIKEAGEKATRLLKRLADTRKAIDAGKIDSKEVVSGRKK